MRAHQPGSQPIDIPELIPNPAVVRQQEPAPKEPAPKKPVNAPERVAQDCVMRAFCNEVVTAEGTASRARQVVLIPMFDEQAPDRHRRPREAVQALAPNDSGENEEISRANKIECRRGWRLVARSKAFDTPCRPLGHGASHPITAEAAGGTPQHLAR
jgi:hypothetical protein